VCHIASREVFDEGRFSLAVRLVYLVPRLHQGRGPISGRWREESGPPLPAGLHDASRAWTPGFTVIRDPDVGSNSGHALGQCATM
jgi:hypothetical protein